MKNIKQKINNVGGNIINKIDERGPYKQDVFEKFIEWSVMTKKEKNNIGITTAKMFATKYKINESHLSRWKQREDFGNHKEQKQQSKLQELTPDILEAFYRRCVKYGMSSDIELWLALVERWNRKKIIEQKKELQFGLNDVRALIKNLSPEKQKYYYQTIARLMAEATAIDEEQKNDY